MAARQVSLSFTISQSLLELMSIESVMPSNHLVLCLPNPKKLTRGQTRNLCKALPRPLLEQEKREWTIGSLACWLPREGIGTSLFVIWAESRGMSKGRAEEMAFMFCPPLRWRCVQGVWAVPHFCYRLFKGGQLGVLVSLYLLPRICPSCPSTQLYLVP